MHMLIDPAIFGAVYGLLFGALLGYFLEARYGYLSVQKYQASKRASEAATNPKLRGWIDKLEGEHTIERPPVDRGVPSTIEGLVREV